LISQKDFRNNEIRFGGIHTEEFYLQCRVAKYDSEGRIQGKRRQNKIINRKIKILRHLDGCTSYGPGGSQGEL